MSGIFYTSSCHCFIFCVLFPSHIIVIQLLHLLSHHANKSEVRRRWKFCFFPKWHLYFSMYMKIWIYWGTKTVQCSMRCKYTKNGNLDIMADSSAPLDRFVGSKLEKWISIGEMQSQGSVQSATGFYVSCQKHIQVCSIYRKTFTCDIMNFWQVYLLNRWSIAVDIENYNFFNVNIWLNIFRYFYIEYLKDLKWKFQTYSTSPLKIIIICEASPLTNVV